VQYGYFHSMLSMSLWKFPVSLFVPGSQGRQRTGISRQTADEQHPHVRSPHFTLELDRFGREDHDREYPIRTLPGAIGYLQL